MWITPTFFSQGIIESDNESKCQKEVQQTRHPTTEKSSGTDDMLA